MTTRVLIRPMAIADMDGAADYIGRENPAAAQRFLAATEATFRHLLETPGLGRGRACLHPKLNDLRSWRIGGFESWLAFYLPREDGIEIVRILHGARDLAPLLSEEDG